MTAPRVNPKQEFVGAARMIAPGDWLRAAERLGCEPAAVRAVAEQESPGGPGFLPDHRPKILFEAHQFGRLTGHRWDVSYPDISRIKWDASLYVGGAGEYDRLHKAMALNRDAALQAASWGRFQVMGFNHADVGFATVDAFVAAMCESEGRQLDIFVTFVTRDPRLHRAIVQKDWATFALIYNGKGYKRNKYDTKIAALYKRFVHDSSLTDTTLVRH